MKFVVTGMAGAVLARDPRLLDSGGAGAYSLNQRPRAGELSPWRQPLEVATVPAGRATIYRMGRDVDSDANYWLSWTTVVHAVRGFLATDTTERTYFTGSGTPKVTDNIIGLATPPYPTTARELGVPAPVGTSPLTQTTPGTGDDRLVFYADTFITDKGEESKPRLIGSITAKPGAVISIASLPPVPAGNYGVTVRRIYRGEATDSGQGEFFFLLDMDPAATTGTDDGRAVGAGTMATTGWEMPPADLKCLTGMWDGMMAGISGRSVRYCVQYVPYAWPEGNVTLPPDVTPVALGVWSKNLIMLTDGAPRLISGSTPDQMGDEPIELGKACLSVKSVANVEHGLCWASGDGLAYFGANGPVLLTDGILTREQWQAMNPETMVGVHYEGCYLGFYKVGTDWLGFAIATASPAGIYFLDKGYPAAYVDKLRNSVFVLDGTSVKKWDAAEEFMTATFTSGTVRAPKNVNLLALEVAARSWPVTVKVYGDGVLRATRTVYDGRPVTIKPGGNPAREFVFEASTSGSVVGISLAPTRRELRDG